MTNLLLDGDHALLLVDGPAFPYRGPIVPQRAVPPIAPREGGPQTQSPQTQSPQTAPSTPRPAPLPSVSGPHLLLVDLAGQPRVLATYTIDGALVDVRQTGATARVVDRSAPRISFPRQRDGMSDAQRIAANREAVDHTSMSQWLLRFESIEAGSTRRGNVPCDAVRQPATYTGHPWGSSSCRCRPME